MKWVPKQYQIEAVEFILENPQCALWLEMGLGKTSATATAIAELMDRLEVFRVLVVAPLRVCKSVWPAEILKWDHLVDIEVREIEGSQKQRSKILDGDFVGIETINYEKLEWLFRDHFKKPTQPLPWDMIVFDESSKLKSAGTKRFRALRRWVDHMPRVVHLTGSPAPAGLLNVWAPTFVLDKGERLGTTFTAFRERWFQTDHMGWKYEARPGTATMVRDKLSDITLSMRSKDYLDLPELIVSDIKVELPPSCRVQYRKLEDEMFLVLEHGTVEVANGGVLTNKCRQLANGALYLNGTTEIYAVSHSEKIAALDDIVEEREGRNLIVAYQFRSDLERLREHYPKAASVSDAEDPDKIIAEWNAGKHAMLLIHPASAGHGLNLQEGGNALAMFGVPWSLDLYEQTIARIAGGLRREVPTFVYRILCAGTVDEAVVASIENHTTIQETLKEQMKRRQAA